MNTDTGKVTGGTIFLLVLISALYLLVPLLYTVYFSGLSLLLKQLPAGISRPYSMTVSGYRNLNYIFYFLKILLAGGY
ncbi:MAG TPA: hypothetical protein VKS21_04545, partial [Spirochaetota bacterium]|nr:hypothetical protein [Spirochaetota bacterium]